MKIPEKALTLSGWAVAIFLGGYVLAGGPQHENEVTQASQIEVVADEMSGSSREAELVAIEPSNQTTVVEELSFGSGYELHPTSVYLGEARPLRLTIDQKNLQSRLREAYQSPVNFGGSLVIFQIGCGTGCSLAYALDKSNGRALRFPIGGEEYQGMGIHTAVDSTLVWASWYTDPSFEECKGQAWKLEDDRFTKLSGVISISCQLKDQVASI